MPHDEPTLRDSAAVDVSRVHHIGIAVESIESELEYYEHVLGLIPDGTEEVPEHMVRAAFFRPREGGALIELLEATSDESPIARHLVKRGPGLHHVAYEVDDLATTLDTLRERGVLVAFLHPASTHGVLTELCQRAT